MVDRRRVDVHVHNHLDTKNVMKDLGAYDDQKPMVWINDYDGNDIRHIYTSLIDDNNVIAISGGKGKGKTATGFQIFNWYGGFKQFVVVDHPRPEVFHNIRSKFGKTIMHMNFEEVKYERNLVIFIDEIQKYFKGKSAMDDLQDFITRIRHNDSVLILCSKKTRAFTVGLEEDIDAWFIFNMRFDKAKRGSDIHDILTIRGVRDKKSFRIKDGEFIFHSFNDDFCDKYGKYNGYHKTTFPEWYNDDISKAYHAEGKIHLEKPSMTMNTVEWEEEQVNWDYLME